jgi:hypothetical protein
MYKKLTRREANRLEQRTLRVSVFAIVALAIAGIGFGLYIGSEAVMLDGFYALTSLFGSAGRAARGSALPVRLRAHRAAGEQLQQPDPAGDAAVCAVQRPGRAAHRW